MKHGESVIVDGDHLWQVKRKGRLPRIVSTEWLMSQPMKDRDGYLWSIPVTEPVIRPWRDLPLDPYVVGSLIANGSMTSKYYTYLTTPDKEVWCRVAKHTPVVDRTIDGYCPRIQLTGVTKITSDLGLRVHSKDKRIPRCYLEASIPQRVALLQGLMVGDGSVRQGGRRSLTYSTTSSGLVEDMIELITSLGGTCSFSKQDRSHDNKPIEYELHILLPLDLTAFDTDRKVAETEPARKFKPRSAIISIEPAGREEVRCITVDAPDHLYLITRAHIVTHNTILMAHGAMIVWQHGERVNVYLHRDTLVDQTVRKLIEAGIPADEIGVVKASKHEIDRRALIVSIHSLRNKERLLTLPKPKLNIIDEAHVSISPTYLNLYDYLGNDAYFVGYTATWVRSDDGKLGDWWEEIVFQRDIRWAVKQGYLAEPRTYQLGGDLDLDLSAIRTTKEGDYNDQDSEAVVMVEEVRDAVVKGYLKMTPGKSAVLFAPTQISARYFGDALKAAGVPTAEIFSGTSKNERKFAFHAFETGAVKVLVTCTALAEGWDSPRCQVALLVRPTKHVGLFIQQVGRVLRPWPSKQEADGKQYAYILDFVGVTDNATLAAAIDLSKTDTDHESKEISADNLEQCEHCDEWRVLRFCEAVELFLCFKCIKELGIEPDEKVYQAKKIVGIHEVDLFENSKAKWLNTYYGQPFIATSNKGRSGVGRIFFIVPFNGVWGAGMTASLTAHDPVTWLATDVTEHEAIDAATFAAMEEDPNIVHKKAAWRRGAPTQAQLNYAYRNGVNPEGLSKSELADAININIASQTLGRLYAPMYEQTQGGVLLNA
jgi:superfamily II DNA or RNA helicase